MNELIAILKNLYTIIYAYFTRRERFLSIVTNSLTHDTDIFIKAYSISFYNAGTTTVFIDN